MFCLIKHRNVFVSAKIFYFNLHFKLGLNQFLVYYSLFFKLFGSQVTKKFKLIVWGGGHILAHTEIVTASYF